jgi:hypothetical protein
MRKQYWVVGATWGGTEDVLPKFLNRGYWYCWDINAFNDEQAGVGNAIKNQQQRFEKIQIGDRIAVKRLLGKAATEMSVLAIGMVKDVDIQEWRIYVDWVANEIVDRRVPLKGCTASIHGPFFNEGQDASWVNQVFCL